MHHGEKLIEGAPPDHVRDRGVVDVYLGQGASERLKAFMHARGLEHG
jgi:branched-chain amino acid transport system ATP-binding protein